jgi:hypothetical protein
MAMYRKLGGRIIPAMSKRAWMSFTVVQLLGGVSQAMAPEYTSSAFIRASLG